MAVSCDYYDVIVIGKTGRGKSTIGNKLLRVSDQSQSCHVCNRLGDTEDTDITGGELEPSRWPYFRTSDDSSITEEMRLLSVTKECKVVANNRIMVRIMDTPGLSDSDPRGANAYQRNLQIVRRIVQEQMDQSKNWKIRRVLYFFPERGVPEVADGTLQDELRILHHFFGISIFKCMVIVATNSKDKRHQDIGFGTDDIAKVQKVFRLALQKSTTLDIPSPPVIYFATSDSDNKLLSKVKDAQVLADEVFVPSFQEGVCSRCNVKIVMDDTKKVVCAYEDSEQPDAPYECSKCHPYFNDKYSTAEKIIGGIGHVVTFGVALMVEAAKKDHKTWPGFTNSEEVCLLCKRPLGSAGCHEVQKETKLCINRQTLRVMVDHTNEV